MCITTVLAVEDFVHFSLEEAVDIRDVGEGGMDRQTMALSDWPHKAADTQTLASPPEPALRSLAVWNGAAVALFSPGNPARRLVLAPLHVLLPFVLLSDFHSLSFTLWPLEHADCKPTETPTMLLTMDADRAQQTTLVNEMVLLH